MSDVKPVPFSKVIKFFKEFETEDRYKHLRVGQAFMNEFYPRDTDSEVFYANNYFVARNLIFSKYVEFENE